MTLDPGHFHSALVHKSMYPEVNPQVFVYAPEGAELDAHINLVEQYNTRENEPTEWDLAMHKGPNFVERMLAEKPGNIVILAGNNQKKTEYILSSVEEGINVLADKPMAINENDFEILSKAFEAAEENEVLIYDVMTERYAITNRLQKEFSELPDVFGELIDGTVENPAITKESVHYISKEVSGSPLIRPAWFFDIEQQGEGIVDVTTHLIDLIQWASFPGEIVDCHSDIVILSANRWQTTLTPEQFQKVTEVEEYPSYLRPYVDSDSLLQVYANGEIIYRLNGVHAKVRVDWEFEAPEGAGDTHYSIMRGSRGNLVIRQGEEQDYQPELYIEPVDEEDNSFGQALEENLDIVRQKYPDLELEKLEDGWKVIIPERYKVGHEAHFSEVTEKYLQYLKEGKLPEWEKLAMISKYWLTTQALKVARENK